jgi:hypothetical protein
MSEAEWIKVDGLALNTPREASIGGEHVMLRLSPHDVPCGVRGSLIASGGVEKFLVEFRYIDEEDWRIEPHSEGVAVRTGKHSGRLFGIEVESRMLKKVGDSVRIEVFTAIDGAVQSKRGSNSARSMLENFMVAKKAVESVANRLFPSPSTA